MTQKHHRFEEKSTMCLFFLLEFDTAVDDCVKAEISVFLWDFRNANDNKARVMLRRGEASWLVACRRAVACLFVCSAPNERYTAQVPSSTCLYLPVWPPSPEPEDSCCLSLAAPFKWAFDCCEILSASETSQSDTVGIPGWTAFTS